MLDPDWGETVASADMFLHLHTHSIDEALGWGPMDILHDMHAECSLCVMLSKLHLFKEMNST